MKTTSFALAALFSTALWALAPADALAQACGPCAEPACGSCGPCGPIRPFGGLFARMACPPASCAPCGETACNPCRPAGPFALLVGLFTHDTWCNCACGERYWGEFSDRPPCYDPCDCQGGYVGGGPVGPAGPAMMGAPVMGPAPGGCATCGSLGHASPRTAARPAYVQNGRMPAAATAQRTVARPTSMTMATPGVRPASATMVGSPYAPRILSETDEVVVPAAQQAQQTRAMPR